MKPQRNNLYLIVFSLMLLLLIAGLCKYFARVTFYGDFNIHLKAQTDTCKSVDFYAITPTGKRQPFYRKDNGIWNLSGYYNAIYFSIDTSDVKNLRLKDSIAFDLNNKVQAFLIGDVLQKWENKLSGCKRIYVLPESFRQDESVLAKLNAVLVFNGFALIPLVLYAVLCLLMLIALLLYYKLNGNFLSILRNISCRTALAASVLLLGIYFSIFLKINSFTDTVPLSGDSWEYQVMAVNFAKGHGIQRSAMLEPFETYKFDKVDFEAESLQNLKELPYYVVDTYRTPGYAAFIGLIYKITGVSPFSVKVLQLFLLCFIAAFLPFLLFKIWQWKGFLSGMAGGFIFILSYYNSADAIMTEVLLIFLSFIIVWMIVSFTKKPSYFLSMLLGLILGISLLVKGMLIFMPIIFFSTLIYYYFKSSDRFFKKNVLILFSFFIITLLPWSIYASSINNFLLVEPLSKKQIITATSSVDKIFENTVITSDNIVEITDSITEIYYRNNYWDARRYYFVKDFIIKRPDLIRKTSEQAVSFIKKEMNQFYRGHLKYCAMPFFNKKYLYINFDGLTLLTIQPQSLLLESNNEHCTDGGWHQEKKYTDFYYKNDNKSSSSVIRVLKFYFKNPKMLFKIFPAKLHTGFKSFIFWQLLVILIITSFLLSLLKIKKSRFWSIFILFAFIPSLLFIVQIYEILLSLSIVAAFLVLHVSYFHKKNPYPFPMPLIFNIFLINLLIITLVFYGLNRFTFITEFIVIPSTLLYLANMVSDVIGEDRPG